MKVRANARIKARTRTVSVASSFSFESKVNVNTPSKYYEVHIRLLYCPTGYGVLFEMLKRACGDLFVSMTQHVVRE